jgi:hypothetical protein
MERCSDRVESAGSKFKEISAEKGLFPKSMGASATVRTWTWQLLHIENASVTHNVLSILSFYRSPNLTEELDQQGFETLQGELFAGQAVQDIVRQMVGTKKGLPNALGDYIRWSSAPVAQVDRARDS